MKFFLDTPIFIYLVEQHPSYSSRVQDFFLSNLLKNNELITSVVTWMEFTVAPKKAGRVDRIESYRELLYKLGIPLVEVTQPIADQAATLRSRYSFLKGMDALQLAVALESGCSKFVSNDKGLLRVTEILHLGMDEL